MRLPSSALMPIQCSTPLGLTGLLTSSSHRRYIPKRHCSPPLGITGLLTQPQPWIISPAQRAQRLSASQVFSQLGSKSFRCHPYILSFHDTPHLSEQPEINQQS